MEDLNNTINFIRAMIVLAEEQGRKTVEMPVESLDIVLDVLEKERSRLLLDKAFVNAVKGDIRREMHTYYGIRPCEGKENYFDLGSHYEPLDSLYRTLAK